MTLMTKIFPFQIQYTRPEDGASVETLSCTNDRELLHKVLDEFLDACEGIKQPMSDDPEVKSIFWVEGRPCIVHTPFKGKHS